MQQKNLEFRQSGMCDSFTITRSMLFLFLYPLIFCFPVQYSAGVGHVCIKFPIHKYMTLSDTKLVCIFLSFYISNFGVAGFGKFWLFLKLGKFWVCGTVGGCKYKYTMWFCISK